MTVHAETVTLESIMGGLRLLSMILSLAVMFWWGPSFRRVLASRDRAGDGARAIWVTLAFSVLLFQVRWLAPGLDELTRMRVWVVAQAAMTVTQIASIYHHGAGEKRFDVRRTMLVHLAMLVACIVFVSVMR
jgi:hypothetical protein